MPTFKFSEYRSRLRCIIAEDQDHIRLLANHTYDADGNLIDSPTDDAAFELTSGRLQREFVSLWGLFERAEEFAECVGHLSELARTLRRSTGYSAIVTCTATAKHLMDQVQARMAEDDENGNDEGVTVHDLGHYPYLSVETRILDLRDERVLIFTDVVATGTLIARLASSVEQLGGEPIGVLSVVIVDLELIAQQQQTGGWPLVQLPKQSLRVYSLTDYAIPKLTPLEVEALNPGNIRRIDDITVLPQERFAHQKRSASLFTPRDTYRLLEDSDALDFGFFRADGRRFTTAVRIERLFANCGAEIWEKIKGLIPADYVLVTTHNRSDLQFKDFIHQKLSDDARGLPSTVLIPRSGPAEPPESYFLLYPSAQLIQGQVVLLFASLHTSEKLHRLVSLLASRPVTKIKVLCLLNRMGTHTHDFVSRIRRLVRGIGPRCEQQDDEHTLFEFSAVFSIDGPSTGDLDKLQHEVDTLLSHYTQSTRVSAFRDMVVLDHRRYFRPRSLSSPTFLAEGPNPIVDENPGVNDVPCPGYRLSRPRRDSQDRSTSIHAEPETNEENLVEVCTQEGWLSLLSSLVAVERNYEPLLQALLCANSKDVLYAIYSLLLLDITFLRLKGRFAGIRKILLDRIRDSRCGRFNREAEAQKLGEDSATVLAELNRSIDLETHLIFGLGLFSFLDNEHDYGPEIRSAVHCDMTPDQWLRYPYNLLAFFTHERVGWTASMLMLLSQNRFHEPETASALKASLRAWLEEASDVFRGFLLDTSRHPADYTRVVDSEREQAVRLKANLDLLLTELGAYALSRKHQVIRFLHAQILTTKRRHSPIQTNLTGVVNGLTEAMDRSREGREQQGGNGQSRARWSLETDRELWKRVKQKVDDALLSVGLLERIAEAARQLFSFAPVSQYATTRVYLDRPPSPGLFRDLQRIRELLSRVRETVRLSRPELEELTRLRNQIFSLIWDPDEILCRSLNEYFVDLREVIKDSLRGTEARLRASGLPYADVWAQEIRRFELSSEPVQVLIARDLLQETLLNLLSNVRHAFNGLEAAPNGQTWQDLVSIELSDVFQRKSPEPDTGTAEYRRISVRTAVGRMLAGTPPTGPVGSTFRKHADEIAEYGGAMTLGSADGEGCVVSLDLLHRHDVTLD